MNKLRQEVSSDIAFINVDTFPEELSLDKKEIDKIKYGKLKKIGISILTQFIEQLEADDIRNCRKMLGFSSGGRDPDGDSNFFIDFSFLGVEGVCDVGSFLNKLESFK